jgi:hypothetical protein
MQAISDEIELAGPNQVDLTRISDLAKEHGDHETLDMDQLALYCRLAALTYRLTLQ